MIAGGQTEAHASTIMNFRQLSWAVWPGLKGPLTHWCACSETLPWKLWQRSAFAIDHNVGDTHSICQYQLEIDFCIVVPVTCQHVWIHEIVKKTTDSYETQSHLIYTFLKSLPATELQSFSLRNFICDYWSIYYVSVTWERVYFPAYFISFIAYSLLNLLQVKVALTVKKKRTKNDQYICHPGNFR